MKKINKSQYQTLKNHTEVKIGSWLTELRPLFYLPQKCINDFARKSFCLHGTWTSSSGNRENTFSCYISPQLFYFFPMVDT